LGRQKALDGVFKARIGLATSLVKLLKEISGESGKTLLMNLHSVELALSFFPRIIGLRDGKILFDSATAEITEEHLRELYTGWSPEGDAPLDRNGHTTPISCHPLPRAL